MAEGGTTVPEIHKKEIETLNENAEYIKNFLKHINKRTSEEMPQETKSVIENLRKDLSELLEIPKKNDWTRSDIKERETGAIRKKNKTEIKTSTSDESVRGFTDMYEDEFKLTSNNKKESTRRSTYKEKFINSSSDEEESESSSSDDNYRARKKTKKRNNKSDKELSLLEKLLTKLDNRKIHELEPYDENSGLELYEYIERFEEYYSQNYRGQKYLWLSALEGKLKGRILQGYRSVRQDDEGYEKVKRKLLKWYDEEKEGRKIIARENFESARMKDYESVLLYCNRLLKLYKIAYPKKDHEKSKILMNKLKRTVNKKMRSIIENQMISHEINDKKITWQKILKLARIYDVENNKSTNDYQDGDEDEEVVVINFNKNNWQNSNRNSDRMDKRENNYESQGSKQNGDRRNRSGNVDWTCKYCGRYGHNYGECRKRLRACFICGKTNHFARDCYGANNRQGNFLNNDRRTNSDNYWQTREDRRDDEPRGNRQHSMLN